MIENITLKSGATIQIPEGFQAKHMNHGQIIKLETPDKALDVFVFETEGNDLKQAMSAAWKTLSPSLDHKVSQTMEPPAPPGFDDFIIQNYVSDEDFFIQGIAQRKNDMIWSFLISGPKAAVLKRNSQITSSVGSLKTPGMTEEDLSQKSLKSIKENLDTFDQFITHAMKVLDVPGLSIAVVENGEIVFEKGYGVKKWGEHDLINEHTLMKIGSTTKSMTTLLMAKLVEEGKFKWDTKAQEIYPRFCVDDEGLSKALTMEQLVGAGTGLPRKDFPMVFNYKEKDPFQQLAITKQTTNVKETFQYNNQLLTAAGYIAAHAVYQNVPMEKAYTDLMMEKIFKSMDMTRTKFSPEDNFAYPHSKTLEGKVQLITFLDDAFTDYSKPAGGIWSSVHDMALYMITELNEGINEQGKRVFDERHLKHRRTPQVKAGHSMSYGLGWLIDIQKGLTHISHGGTTCGYHSAFGFYPDKQCGYVMLTNGFGGQYLNDVIRRKLLELWFDTLEKSAEMLDYGTVELKKFGEEIRENLLEPHSEWIKPFLGKHKNDELGLFEIIQGMNNYYLKTATYKTKLMINEAKNGNKTIAWVDPPGVGIKLIPLSGSSFKIMEGQHCYEFENLGD